MDLKRAPKKILDDGLVNVVVELHIVPEYARVSLEKKIEDAFLAQGQVLGKYVIKNRLGNNTAGANLHFLSNQVYKLFVEETCISFNIVDRYPGWADFELFIKSVIGVLPILQFTKVSIQYISVFEDVLIFNQIEGDVSLPHFDKFVGSELNFHYGHEERGLDVALVDVRLTNNMLNPNLNKYASMTDIKVRCGGDAVLKKEEMLARLELVHDVQHRCFFELLKEDFINTRRPIYE